MQLGIAAEAQHMCFQGVRCLDTVLFACAAGVGLEIVRLVLRNISLASAAPKSAGVPAGLPRLLPLGLLAAFPSKLILTDVQLVVKQQDFQDYLQMFSQQLQTIRTPGNTGPLMHTVRPPVIDASLFHLFSTFDSSCYSVFDGACAMWHARHPLR